MGKEKIHYLTEGSIFEILEKGCQIAVDGGKAPNLMLEFAAMMLDHGPDRIRMEEMMEMFDTLGLKRPSLIH